MLHYWLWLRYLADSVIKFNIINKINSFKLEINQYFTALFIMLYCLAFGVSLGPIGLIYNYCQLIQNFYNTVWLYMPEIVPFKAVSLASSFNW